MAKRFTDTTIWKNQKWFKKLDPIHKLAWKYLTDVCDHAGIWKIDIGELTDDLGLEEFSLQDFMDQCNTDYDKKTGKKISRKRILLVKEEFLWLTGFIKFQYEGKSRKVDGTSKVANSAIEILNGFGLLQKAIQDEKFFELKINELSPIKPHQAHPNPIDPPLSPSDPLQGDKDKERDKVKEKGKGLEEKEIQEGVGGFSQGPFLMQQMQEVWISAFPSYTKDRELDYPALRAIADFVFKNAGVKNGYGDLDQEIKVLNTFQLIADQVNREPFWQNKPLMSISKNIQEFYNKIKNPIDAKESKSKFNKNGAATREQLNDLYAKRFGGGG
jgi:hypothetical protein